MQARDGTTAMWLGNVWNLSQWALTDAANLRFNCCIVCKYGNSIYGHWLCHLFEFHILTSTNQSIVSKAFTTLFIQVNRSPSFSTDTKLDWDIKFAVIKDALQLLNIRCRTSFSLLS